MSSPAKDAHTPVDSGTVSPGTAPPPRSRRWVALSFVVLVILVLVAAGAGFAALLTHGFHSKTTVKYHQAAVFSLRVGDCINLTSTGTKADVVSCTKPHDAEVVGPFQLSGAWPGG